MRLFLFDLLAYSKRSYIIGMMVLVLGFNFINDDVWAQSTSSDNGNVTPTITATVYYGYAPYNTFTETKPLSSANANLECADMVPSVLAFYDNNINVTSSLVDGTTYFVDGGFGWEYETVTGTVVPYNSNDTTGVVGWYCYIYYTNVNDPTQTVYFEGTGWLFFGGCPGQFANVSTPPGGQNNPLYCANPVSPVPIQPKNTSCNCGIADPIDAGTGNSYQKQTDFISSAPASGLNITRTYNSSPTDTDENVIHTFGTRWSQPYDAKITQIANVTQPASAAYFAPYSCWQRVLYDYVFCSPPQTVGPTAATSTTPQLVEVKRGSGEFQYFTSTSPGVWTPAQGTVSQLTSTLQSDDITPNGYIFTDTDNHKEVFDGNGNLLSIVAPGGSAQQLTYSAGNNDSSVSRYPATAPICSHVQSGSALPALTLLCVTDQWGRQLQFEHDLLGRTTATIDPNNQVTLYTYDGPSAGCTNPGLQSQFQVCTANNLTSIIYPDGKTKTLYYNEAAQIQSNCTNVNPVGGGFYFLLHDLTGIVDENGNRTNSWTYNCTGVATGSFLGNGMDSYQIAVGTPNASGISSSSVTSPLGAQMTYGFTQINGVTLNNSIAQPTGSGSAAATASSTYDVYGNMSSHTDFNGNITNYTYDTTRNLELTRVEGYGTAQARTITTVWNPSYRLPNQIAEPLKLTTYTYDTNGNLLTRTQQATTDTNGSQGVSATVTGAPRIWTYTYNNVGQVLTIVGPRTDVVDKTQFAYDNYGNLNTVTNAANQVTTLSNYDMNGHVGTITDPNGLVTTYTYSPRGWMTSQTRGSEVTTYNYDGVGQLIGVTFPNSATLTYTYDTAHRLTNIADNLGNTVNYTLDVMGNRTLEQVDDASGNLNRQISRVVDTLNRLQQITGAQ